MIEEILSVSGVSKVYTSFASEFSRFGRWFGLPTKAKSEFWAAKDITFSMRRGECIALVGQNGAGKSTLLKLITGTISPTVGQISVNGRVNAILELGIGFNPELTGRENIYHSGGMMGYSPQQIADLIPSIQNFAEIGDFFDQPLRFYSSGMQARLAFSLATAMRPDILIVDEVLSVGDSYFQHKSFARIRQFREQGTSILVVTHGLAGVREICDRAILLDKGEIIRDGLPDEIIDYYNAMIADKQEVSNRKNLSIEQKRNADGWLVSRSGTFEAIVESIQIHNTEKSDPVDSVKVGQDVYLRIDARTQSEVPRLILGIMMRDRLGHIVWGTNTWHTNQVVEGLNRDEKVAFIISFKCNLGPGSYSITTALTSSSTHLENNYEWTDNLFVFDVVNVGIPTFVGSTYLNTEISINTIEISE